MEVEVRAWRVRSAGPVGYWLFWDPSVETVKLYAGGQAEAPGTEDAGDTREGREAEAGRAMSSNKTLAECEDPLQFALPLEVDDG